MRCSACLGTAEQTEAELLLRFLFRLGGLRGRSLGSSLLSGDLFIGLNP